MFNIFINILIVNYKVNKQVIKIVDIHKLIQLILELVKL